MNYQESLEYLYHAKQAGAVKRGLANITELLYRLGNPEAVFPSVHVAGTNGKGSTCAFLESMLRTAGYRTGLYTSPFLERFTERIRIGGAEISEEAFATVATRVRDAADSMLRDGLPHPTFFELVTACCFLHFAESRVDVAIVETGLGGRTDATNVLSPLVSVITTIGIDHAHVLGSSIEEIAAEKAGIIKPDTPVVVSGANAPATLNLLRRAALAKGCPFVSGGFWHIETAGDDLSGQTFHVTGEETEYRNLTITLLGSHQRDNAATALLAALELNKVGFSVTEEAIRRGLAETRWPGRLELLDLDPTVLIDGAHNPQGAEALADSAARYLAGQPVCLVMGSMADKDAHPMVRQFARFATRVIVTVPPTHGRQQQDVEQLAGWYAETGTPAIAMHDCHDAFAEAMRSGMAVVVAGSLYLVGAFRSWYVKEPRH